MKEVESTASSVYTHSFCYLKRSSSRYICFIVYSFIDVTSDAKLLYCTVFICTLITSTIAKFLGEIAHHLLIKLEVSIIHLNLHMSPFLNTNYWLLQYESILVPMFRIINYEIKM